MPVCGPVPTVPRGSATRRSGDAFRVTPSQELQGEKKANGDKYLLARMWTGYTSGIEFICACSPNQNTLNAVHEEQSAQVDAMKRRCSDARPSTLGERRHVVAAARPRRLQSRLGESLRCLRFEPMARAGTADCSSEDLRELGPGVHLTGRSSGPATNVAAFDDPSGPAAHLQR